MGDFFIYRVCFIGSRSISLTTVPFCAPKYFSSNSSETIEPRLLYASFALAVVFTYGALLNIFIFNRCNEMHLMLNIVLEKIYKIM